MLAADDRPTTAVVQGQRRSATLHDRRLRYTAIIVNAGMEMSRADKDSELIAIKQAEHQNSLSAKR